MVDSVGYFLKRILIVFLYPIQRRDVDSLDSSMPRVNRTGSITPTRGGRKRSNINSRDTSAHSAPSFKRAISRGHQDNDGTTGITVKEEEMLENLRRLLLLERATLKAERDQGDHELVKNEQNRRNIQEIIVSLRVYWNYSCSHSFMSSHLYINISQQSLSRVGEALHKGERRDPPETHPS